MSTTIFHWIPSSELGGIEMAALTLMQESPQYVHVVATGDASGPAVAMWRDEGAEVVEMPEWKDVLGLRWVACWRRFVRDHDIRHLIAWSPTRFTMLSSSLRSDARCLVHLGNVGGFSPRARLQERIAGALLRPRCLPKLMACSKAVLESAAREPVFSKLPCRMVHNPVRKVFFAAGEARQANQPCSGIWGMVARLDRLKDHRTLIQAVKLLPMALDFRLEIVGEGALEGELKQLVASSGLESKVIFRGATSAPQEALGRWDGFVFSTTAAEGFGIAAAEAMAAGLPCIMSDLPALREVAGEDAYYATSGEPKAFAERLVHLMREPELARVKGEAARVRAASYFMPHVFARAYLQELGLVQSI